MRRNTVLSGVGILLGVLLLTGCHSHEWAEATCVQPRTCTECGETEGETLEHTWQEATCAQPRTCGVCGETEGEALPHTLTDANYQQAAVCTVCGAEVGEPLQADFEKYGLTCVEAWDTPYPYISQCPDNMGVTASGTVTFSGHQVFLSDDAHEALDGYEWHTFTMTCLFSNDVNAIQYGGSAHCTSADYYDIAGFNASDTEAVHFYDVEYTECTYDTEVVKNAWEGDDLIFQFECTARLPVGYDGFVIAFVDRATALAWDSETTLIHEAANENTLLFRVR